MQLPLSLRGLLLRTTAAPPAPLYVLPTALLPSIPISLLWLAYQMLVLVLSIVAAWTRGTLLTLPLRERRPASPNPAIRCKWVLAKATMGLLMVTATSWRA
jgi:hypothetical protein